MLIVKGPSDDIDTLTRFFTEAFDTGSDINIGYMARYTFVPSQPLGDITSSHLQSLLYRQKLFHSHIKYFIVHGLKNLDTLPPQPEFPHPQTQPVPTVEDDRDDIDTDNPRYPSYTGSTNHSK